MDNKEIENVLVKEGLKRIQKENLRYKDYTLIIEYYSKISGEWEVWAK